MSNAMFMVIWVVGLLATAVYAVLTGDRPGTYIAGGVLYFVSVPRVWWQERYMIGRGDLKLEAPGWVGGWIHFTVGLALIVAALVGRR